MRLSQFSSGAHAEVYAALRKLQKRGAKAFVLDLRGNGGGLVSEAQLIASAFLKDGPIVTTRGRAVKEQTLRATGDPVVPTAPIVVLVDGDTASASEIVTGALQDRDRAKVVGTETFGKGVFQEVLELSNGGALDITAGQYFTPKGRNLGGKGVATGKGIIARRPSQGRPQDEDRRGARPGDGRRRRQVPVLTDAPPRVVLLEQRGRFLVGEPFFERGRRVTIERSRDARPGRLALLQPHAKGGRAQDRPRPRAPGRRPRRHRGADARSRPAALVPARRRARRGRTRTPPDVARRDLRDLPTFTIDPVTARDFDDAISCEALGDEHWRVWVHIADVSAYVRPGGAVDREAYRRATSVYVPGRGRADAARGAVERRLLAAPGRRSPRGHRRARAARRADRQARPSTAR